MVAADAGELVGYVMFQTEIKPPLEMNHKVCYVMDLYVRPSHRRRGMAKQLLQSCLDRVKSKGVTHVQLRVWHMNKGAIGLYRQFGFRDRIITMQPIT